MSGYTISKIFNVLSRTNGPIAGASTKTLLSANLTKDGAGNAYTPVFNSGTLGTAQDKVRSGINITAYASPIYIKFVPYGTLASALTVTAADYDVNIPAGTVGVYALDRSIDVIIFTAGNFSAIEVGG